MSDVGDKEVYIGKVDIHLARRRRSACVAERVFCVRKRASFEGLYQVVLPMRVSCELHLLGDVVQRASLKGSCASDNLRDLRGPRKLLFGCCYLQWVLTYF